MISTKVCLASAIVAAGVGGPMAQPSSVPPVISVVPAGAANASPNFALPASANPTDQPILFGLDDLSDPRGGGSPGFGPTEPGDRIEAPIGFDPPDYRPLPDAAFVSDPADPGSPVGGDPPADRRRADFAPVPEPSTLPIVGVGLLALIVTGRRRSEMAQRQPAVG